MDLRIQGPVSRPGDERYAAATATWPTRVPVSNALHTAFVTAAIVAAEGLLVVVYLRERPLRKDTS